MNDYNAPVSDQGSPRDFSPPRQYGAPQFDRQVKRSIEMNASSLESRESHNREQAIFNSLSNANINGIRKEPESSKTPKMASMRSSRDYVKHTVGINGKLKKALTGQISQQDIIKSNKQAIARVS